MSQTIAFTAPGEMVASRGGGVGILPIMTYMGGGAPPERGTFSKLQVFKTVGISKV